MTTEPVDVDEEIIVTLSDYLDGVLPAEKKAEVEAKIASDPQWKSAHADMVETREALSGLQKARAPESFSDGVTQTIHKRSAGRFFAKKTFGDRVPFGAILIVALLGLGIIAYVIWRSPTGSLKVAPDRTPAPQLETPIVDKP
jgi:anti-sigma factor RsiW